MSAVIRSAAPEDLPALAALKTRYLTCRYQGFARADILRKACPDRYLPELTSYLASPLCHLDILEGDREAEGYIVYRREGDEADGWILETRSHCSEGCVEDTSRLIQHAALRLRQDGCTVVRTWLLKSNYRLRFLYENLGFRFDGERRIDDRDGQGFEMMRYTFYL